MPVARNSIQASFAVGLLCWTLACASFANGQDAAPKQTTSYKFDFGAGAVESGYTQVRANMTYTRERGFGFEAGAKLQEIARGGDDALRGDFVTSSQPFSFSVALPEGNYNVKITLGDAQESSTTTVKAELRRLMLEKVTTEPGKFVTKSLTINTRTPRISTGGQVSLKPREKAEESAAWDDKLTLEFNNTRPCLCALEIERADDVPTLYILGDSTVCDQPSEPWSSWGQSLTRFFKDGLAISNQAESGEAVRSSTGAHRLDKVLSTMKKGDYLFVQFGHNDMKSVSEDAYKSDLKRWVTQVRQKEGTPVLITPVERKNGITSDTLRGFPDAVRSLAKEEKVALIDLHATSKVLYKALGSNLNAAFQDGTHHNNYGSYLVAKCIVNGIKQSNLDLVKFIAEDFQDFDPAKPDPLSSFQIPKSAGPLGRTPDGN